MPSSSSTERKPFSLGNLDVFKRPGATLTACDSDDRAGVWVDLANGWRVSIQWGRGDYGDNHDCHGKPGDSSYAEVAVMKPGHEGTTDTMVRWGEGEWGHTVLGYVPMERVQHIIDLTDRGELVRMWQPTPPPPEERAIDNWPEGPDA